jgi:hypothetical protein
MINDAHIIVNQVLAAINQYPEGVYPYELAELFDIKVALVHKILRVLIMDQKICSMDSKFFTPENIPPVKPFSF